MLDRAVLSSWAGGVALRSGVVGTLLLLCLATGCSFEVPAGKPADKGTKEAKKEEPRTLVVVETPRRDVIRESVTLNGDLEALDTIELTSLVAERVRAVHFQEGDRVKVGDLLVEFDDSDRKFAVDEAKRAYEEAKQNHATAILDEREALHAEELRKLAYEKAQREYARIEKVIEAGDQRALTQEEVEQRLYARDDGRLQWQVAQVAREKAKVKVGLTKLAEEQRRIALERAQLDRSRTEVRSPIQGTVSLLEVRPGEYVASGVVVAAVVNAQQLFADVRLPQRTLPLLAPGKPVQIQTEVFPEIDFSGRVAVVHPTIDPNEGTVKVRVTLDPDPRLRPGMYAAVSFDLLVHENALLVPKRARLFENSESILFVVRDGRAHRLSITVGLQNSNDLEVLPVPGTAADAVLKDDDRIVVRGQSQLKDGVAVIVEGDEPPAAEAVTESESNPETDPAATATANSEDTPAEEG